MAKVTMQLNGSPSDLSPDKIYRTKQEIAREPNKNLVLKLLDDPNYQGDITKAPGTIYLYNQTREKWSAVTNTEGTPAANNNSHIHTNKSILDQLQWSPNSIGNSKKIMTIEQYHDDVSIGLEEYKEGIPMIPEGTKTRVLMSKNGKATWSDTRVPANITTIRKAIVDSHYQIELTDVLFNPDHDQILVFDGMIYDLEEGAVTYCDEDNSIVIQLNSDNVEVDEEVKVLIIKNSITEFGLMMTQIDKSIDRINKSFNDKIVQLNNVNEELVNKHNAVLNMEQQINVLNQTITILTTRLGELEKKVTDNHNITSALLDRNKETITEVEKKLNELKVEDNTVDK